MVDIFACPCSSVMSVCICWHKEKNKQNGKKFQSSIITIILNSDPLWLPFALFEKTRALFGIHPSSNQAIPF